jgi:hypothetical protein
LFILFLFFSPMYNGSSWGSGLVHCPAPEPWTALSIPSWIILERILEWVCWRTWTWEMLHLEVQWKAWICIRETQWQYNCSVMLLSTHSPAKSPWGQSQTHIPSPAPRLWVRHWEIPLQRNPGSLEKGKLGTDMWGPSKRLVPLHHCKMKL